MGIPPSISFFFLPALQIILFHILFPYSSILSHERKARGFLRDIFFRRVIVRAPFLWYTFGI